MDRAGFGAGRFDRGLNGHPRDGVRAGSLAVYHLKSAAEACGRHLTTSVFAKVLSALLWRIEIAVAGTHTAAEGFQLAVAGSSPPVAEIHATVAGTQATVAEIQATVAGNQATVAEI